MKLIILPILLLANCISFYSNSYPITNPPTIIKAMELNPSVKTRNKECGINFEKVFNEDGIFNYKKNVSINAELNCSKFEIEGNKAVTLINLFLTYITIGVIPYYSSDRIEDEIIVYYDGKKIKSYKYSNTVHNFGSILFSFMLLFEKSHKDYDNFLINTARDIYKTMPTEIVKYEEEKRIKLEEQTKKEIEQDKINEERRQKEKELAEIEYQKEQEKIKAIKPTKLPIGAIYCNEEHYILGLTYNGSQNLLSQLEFIKVCFELEESVQVKLIPSEHGVYFFKDKQKFFSTKKLLRVK